MTLSLKPHYSAVVIGGGQAGLSASHYMKKHGIDHVVVEKEALAHEPASRDMQTEAASEMIGSVQFIYD